MESFEPWLSRMETNMDGSYFFDEVMAEFRSNGTTFESEPERLLHTAAVTASNRWEAGFSELKELA